MLTQSWFPQLNDVQQANLWQMIQGSAPDGGVWNGRKVAGYLSKDKWVILPLDQAEWHST
jgi:hypothetical protein